MLYHQFNKYKSSLTYIYLSLFFLSFLASNVSKIFFFSSNMFTFSVKILIIFLTIFFFLTFAHKNLDIKFKSILYFIISFLIISLISKMLFSSDISVNLMNFRFAVLTISCFLIYFIFRNLDFKFKHLLLAIILFNLISFFIMMSTSYDDYDRPIREGILAGNRNPQNVFIYCAFFTNFLILKKKFGNNFFKNIIFSIFQIIFIYHIYNYANIYVTLTTIITLFVFALNFILKEKKVFSFVKNFFFLTLLLIFSLILITASGYLTDLSYLIYFNFLEILANLLNVDARSVCWEDTLTGHDVDLIYKLHIKYPLHCWQFSQSLFDHLWELWMGIILRSYYFTESLNILITSKEFLFGHNNPNEIYSSGIFPHNSYIDIFIKYGFFGFLSILILFFFIGINFIKNKNFYGLLFFTSILFAMNMDDYLLGHRYEVTVILWFLIGILSNKQFLKKLEI